MTNPNNVGLEALFQTEAFQKGLRIYVAGTQAATQATKVASKGVGFAGNAISTALGGILTHLTTSVIPAFIAQVKEIGVNAIMTAGRVNEMDGVLRNLGKTAGVNSLELQRYVESIKDTGIRTDVAQGLVATFIRYNLDLAKATDVARVAQDAAVLSMTDSSEALNWILYGIQTYNTRILRTQGINVNVQQSFEDYAKTLGITSDALTETQKQQAVLEAVLVQGQAIAGTYATAMDSPTKRLRSLSRVIYEINNLAGQPFQQAFNNVVTIMTTVAKAFQKNLQAGQPLQQLLVRVAAVAELFTDKLVVAVDVGLDALFSFLKDSGSTFDNFAASAFDWGSNIVISLAEGMAAAMSAVIGVLLEIGNVLSNWLSPGSPPKIAPKLDKWGADAMTEYMKGWQSGDFSVFNELAGTIESFIRSLGTSKIKEENLIPRILGTREAIADAVDEVRQTGVVTEDVLNRIMRTAGKLTDVFRDYIRTVLTAETANQKLADAQAHLTEVTATQDAEVTAAQDNLNTVTDEYDAILESLNQQLSRRQAIVDEDIRLAQIQTALESGLLTDTEKKRLQAEKADIEARKQIRTVEDQRKVAIESAQARVDATEAARQSAIDEAQQGVATAQAEVDRVLEQLEAQKALIGVQEEQNSLIAQQIDLLKRLAEQMEKTAAGGSGGFTGGGFNIPEPEGQTKITGPLDTLQSRIDQIKNDIQERIDELMAGISAPFEGMFGPGGKIDTLTQTFAGIWEGFWNPDGRISTAVSGLFGEEGTLPPIVSGFFESTFGEDGLVQSFLNFGLDWWTEHGTSLNTIVSFIFSVLGQMFTQGLGVLFMLWDWFGGSVMGTIGNLWNIVITWFLNGFSIVGEILDIWAALLTGDFESFKESVLSIISLLWDTVSTIFTSFVGPEGIIGGVVNEFITWAQDAINNLFTPAGGANIFDTILGDALTIITGFFEPGGWYDQLIIEWIGNVKDAISNMLTGEGGGNVFEELFKDAFDIFKSYLGEEGTIKKLVNNFVEKVIELFNRLYNTLVGNSIVPDMMAAVTETFGDWLQEALAYILQFTGNSEAAFNGMADEVVYSSIVPDMLDAINREYDKGLGRTENQINRFASFMLDTYGMLDNAVFNGPSLQTSTLAPVNRSTYVTNNTYDQRSTKVEVNPTYTGIQTPNAILLDVNAAFAAANI